MLTANPPYVQATDHPYRTLKKGIEETTTALNGTNTCNLQDAMSAPH